MWNDRWKALVEVALCIGLSILFVELLGDISGVFFGTAISSILAPLWVEPYVVYKNYFKKSTWKYLGWFAIFTAITAAAGTGAYLICSLLPYGFWFIGVRLVICTSVVGTTYIISFFMTKEFKKLIGIAKTLFPKQKKQ